MKPLPHPKARLYRRELRKIRHLRRIYYHQIRKLDRREESLRERLNTWEKGRKRDV
jgi:hypothetical protein